MNVRIGPNQRPKAWARVFMAGAVSVLAVLCFESSGYSHQVSPAAAQGYEGTWRAERKGKNFMVLTFHEAKGQLSGSVRMMDTHFNMENEGEIYEVSGELSEPTPLKSMHSDGKALFFEWIEEGDTEATHWRMEIVSPGKAKLQWIQLPKGLKAQAVELLKDGERQ